MCQLAASNSPRGPTRREQLSAHPTRREQLVTHPTRRKAIFYLKKK